jgi:hypothetical protein
MLLRSQVHIYQVLSVAVPHHMEATVECFLFSNTCVPTFPYIRVLVHNVHTCTCVEQYFTAHVVHFDVHSWCIITDTVHFATHGHTVGIFFVRVYCNNRYYQFLSRLLTPYVSFVSKPTYFCKVIRPLTPVACFFLSPGIRINPCVENHICKCDNISEHPGPPSFVVVCGFLDDCAN